MWPTVEKLSARPMGNGPNNFQKPKKKKPQARLQIENVRRREDSGPARFGDAKGFPRQPAVILQVLNDLRARDQVEGVWRVRQRVFAEVGEVHLLTRFLHEGVKVVARVGFDAGQDGLQEQDEAARPLNRCRVTLLR